MDIHYVTIVGSNDCRLFKAKEDYISVSVNAFSHVWNKMVMAGIFGDKHIKYRKLEN